MGKNYDSLRKAIMGSIVAAIIIQVILAVILLEGLAAIFEPPTVYGMIALVAIAFYVYRHLLDSVTISKTRVKYLGPTGALLAAAGLVAAVYHSVEAGGGLIVAAYYSELLLGLKLREDLLEYKATGVDTFIAGMLTFILSLPIVIINSKLAIIPFIGNLVKTYGLVAMYNSIRAQA